MSSVDKRYMKGLCGPARILLTESAEAWLRQRAGRAGMSQVDMDRFERRVRTLSFEQQGRLEKASMAWRDAQASMDGETLAATIRARQAPIAYPDHRMEDAIYFGDLDAEGCADVRRALGEGNMHAFAKAADVGKADPLELVVRNAGLLAARGYYEPALLAAYRSGRLHRWPPATVRWLFRAADPVKLRALGDPLPEGACFTVYRGGGAGAAMSWTSDRMVSALYASANPEQAVIARATLPAADVAVYLRKVFTHTQLPQLLGDRADEWITTAELAAEPLDADETDELFGQIRAAMAEQ